MSPNDRFQVRLRSALSTDVIRLNSHLRERSSMDRRVFIDAMTASMVGAPLVAIAQKSAGVRRIGTLTTDAPETQATLDRIYAPLRALGWVEGQNLRVERRYASSNVELLRPFAEDQLSGHVVWRSTCGVRNRERYA